MISEATRDGGCLYEKFINRLCKANEPVSQSVNVGKFHLITGSKSAINLS
jgi:hypothetical protein